MMGLKYFDGAVPGKKKRNKAMWEKIVNTRKTGKTEHLMKSGGRIGYGYILVTRIWSSRWIRMNRGMNHVNGAFS